MRALRLLCLLTSLFAFGAQALVGEMHDHGLGEREDCVACSLQATFGEPTHQRGEALPPEPDAPIDETRLRVAPPPTLEPLDVRGATSPPRR